MVGFETLLELNQHEEFEFVDVQHKRNTLRVKLNTYYKSGAVVTYY